MAISVPTSQMTFSSFKLSESNPSLIKGLIMKISQILYYTFRNAAHDLNYLIACVFVMSAYIEVAKKQ